MIEHLNLANSVAWARELELDAARRRLASGLNGDGAASVERSSAVVIRAAREEDFAALKGLAERDGLRLPEGARLLVAEVEGELLAALPFDGGDPIADPFRATADLVEMLELRAGQLRGSPAPRRRLRDRMRVFTRKPAPAVAPATPGNAVLLMRRDSR